MSIYVTFFFNYNVVLKHNSVKMYGLRYGYTDTYVTLLQEYFG